MTILSHHAAITSEETSTSEFSGHLHLTASARPDGRTFLSHQSFRAPFHLSKPHSSDEALHVQIVNSTAGMLAGDRLELDVRVEEQAALALTTPSAARAFMMRTGTAEYRQRLAVADHGWLEYSPEPLFCHRECTFTQETTIDLASQAGLFFVDALAPGRAGSGEQWAWRRLVLGLQLRIADELVLQERLDASGEKLGTMAQFFGTPNAWFATAIVAAPNLSPDDDVWERVRVLQQERLSCGVTRLRATSWIIRLVAPDGLELRDALAALRELFAPALPGLGCNLRKV